MVLILINHLYLHVMVSYFYYASNFSSIIFFLVTSSIEHITFQATCDLEAPSEINYTLKVWGYNEYFAPTTLLSDYEYVHNCIKLEEDVLLILLPDNKVDKSFARTVSLKKLTKLFNFLMDNNLSSQWMTKETNICYSKMLYQPIRHYISHMTT